MKTFLIIIIVGLILWVAWSYYFNNVEQLKYTVIERKANYEIRQYEKYIAMQTEVQGNFKEGIYSGFRILASYIFGDNVKKESVAMTAPVIENIQNEKVTMTAPVLSEESEGKRIITFTAPSKYTLDTLPTPNTDKIKFVEVPEKKIAAYTFGWYFTETRVEKMKKEFLQILKQDNQKVIGEPKFAGYNGPGTMPLLIRNEILVEIE